LENEQGRRDAALPAFATSLFKNWPHSRLAQHSKSFPEIGNRNPRFFQALEKLARRSLGEGGSHGNFSKPWNFFSEESRKAGMEQANREDAKQRTNPPVFAPSLFNWLTTLLLRPRRAPSEPPAPFVAPCRPMDSPSAPWG
jgi:hypothetical protein